jgi:hypothetical protein
MQRRLHSYPARDTWAERRQAIERHARPRNYSGRYRLFVTDTGSRTPVIARRAAAARSRAGCLLFAGTRYASITASRCSSERTLTSTAMTQGYAPTPAPAVATRLGPPGEAVVRTARGLILTPTQHQNVPDRSDEGLRREDRKRPSNPHGCVDVHSPVLASVGGQISLGS